MDAASVFGCFLRSSDRSEFSEIELNFTLISLMIMKNDWNKWYSLILFLSFFIYYFFVGEGKKSL